MIKNPGKFENEMYATRFAYDNADDSLGESDGFGWYGIFSGPIKGRGPFHIIVREDSQGFVYGEYFDTEEALNKAWEALGSEYSQFCEESEEA